MRRTLIALSDSNLVHGLLLVGLLCLFPIKQLRGLSSAADPDIWWHIRVGQWIVEHHAFPHQGIFSAVGATHPWAAYSWGFEVIMAALNRALGLMGIPLFVIAFDVALVLVIFLVTRFFSRSFWWAWLLSAVAVWAMDLNRVNVARPVSISILLFTLELALIFRSQETRNEKYLYWLPLVFLVWANFHIQFVYGLVLPGLFAAVISAERWVTARWSAEGVADETQALRPAMLWAIFAACVAATLVNPYTVGLYRIVFNYMRSTFAYSVILEFQAPSFRQVPHFIQLLLLAAAFFAMGRRKLDPYKAIIAYSVRPTDPEAGRLALRTRFLHLGPVLAGALFVIALSAADNGFSNRALLQVVHDSYPLEAVKFIQERHFPGPLYNNFNWGGFLIGTLPDYPVSIDGRTDLYGDAYFRQELETLMGRRSDDQVLDRANLVLLPSSVPLCGILQSSSQFRVVYADNLAKVFVRNPYVHRPEGSCRASLAHGSALPQRQNPPGHLPRAIHRKWRRSSHRGWNRLLPPAGEDALGV